MKNCLGIEIGHYRVKIAYMERGKLKKYVSERIETKSMTDMRLYAEFIQDVLHENGILCRNAVFVLRQDDTYVKRLQLPLMTVDQLKLNLPYEFQDYIGDQLNEYQFDYAVISRTEDQLDLLAAACKKELCQQFQKFAKMARLKLVGLVPAVVGLERILEHASQNTGSQTTADKSTKNRNITSQGSDEISLEDAAKITGQTGQTQDGRPMTEKKDYAILDLGTKALRIHFFRKGIYDITRTMEPGCEEIERLRRGDKETVMEMDVDAEDAFWSKKSEEAIDKVLADRYQTIAVQTMRVLNFYSFNNSDNTIDTLYYCGGGARYQALIDTISDTLDIPVKSIGVLLPEVHEDEMPEWRDSPQTFGVMLT